MLTPEILLTLKIQQQLFIDPRRIALLKALAKTASLNQAAKQVGISYKTAWDAIKAINQLSPNPFVISSTGGKGGGSTRLSAYAVRFLQLYDLLTTLQHNAFSILSDDDLPLNDLLTTTAKLSLQTSARNQLYGTVTGIEMDNIAGFVTVKLSDNRTHLKVFITKASVERLKLDIDKSVLLLIKAPLIELASQKSSLQKSTLQKSTNKSENSNRITAIIENITHNNHWCEFQLKIDENLILYVSKEITEIEALNLNVGNKVTLIIDPEHIIIATLV
ncbi:TOBE domain-containing protein [Orbaceae bacterium ESL0721]|nr:TOBE domain-containing protein [Orbaceae bacterium ESL0721]